MSTTSDGFRPELRVPVDAPWMPGADAECVVFGNSITLRDARLGSEVILSTLDFKGRKGRTLRFRSQAGSMGGGLIEFAGLGRDAWFDVTCIDEVTAMMVADRISNLIDEAP